EPGQRPGRRGEGIGQRAERGDEEGKDTRTRPEKRPWTHWRLLLGSRLARRDPYLASGKMGRYDPRHDGNSRGFPGDFRGTMKGSARVGFGDFVLDGGTRQLLRDGTERHLEPKAFALLELLVARRPDAVSKAEVRDRLWPDAFVSESTLTGLVAQVR